MRLSIKWTLLVLNSFGDHNATGEHKVDQKKSVENIKFFVIYF